MDPGFHCSMLVAESAWSNPRPVDAAFLIENVVGNPAHLKTILTKPDAIRCQRRPKTAHSWRSKIALSL
jgi:hypothetical protein